MPFFLALSVFSFIFPIRPRMPLKEELLSERSGEPAFADGLGTSVSLHAALRVYSLPLLEPLAE